MCRRMVFLMRLLMSRAEFLKEAFKTFVAYQIILFLVLEY